MLGCRGRRLGRLFAFKRWLTISEAAEYLSLVLQESVRANDVLRLGLDRHLTLSVRFVNTTTAVVGKAIPFSEANHEPVPTLDGTGVFSLLEGVPFGPDKVIVFEEGVVSISDIWDMRAPSRACLTEWH